MERTFGKRASKRISKLNYNHDPKAEKLGTSYYEMKSSHFCNLKRLTA
jgi:hypothetical protein